MAKVKRRAATTTTTTIYLSAKDIIDSLKDSIPSNARDIKVIFNVPSGGDYPGERLDLAEEFADLEVIYKVETAETY